ncbi:MAG: hypothetical protein HFH87_08635 [Lachnospiraceae bacterium]|nr:hypothetical protein [Lachnospiraceae bacterium]
MKRERILTGNYRKVFTAACIVITVVIMLLLSMAMREKKEYHYSLDRTIASGDGQQALCESIQLPAGIYSVSVDYQTTADLTYAVSLTDDTMPPLKVMQNEQCLAAVHSSETFRLWLLGKSENLTLWVSGDSVEGIYFDQLCIKETGQFWYCMICFVLVLGILVLGCIFCAAWHRIHRISISDFAVAGGIVILTFLLSRPFLMNWLCAAGDVGYHLERIDGVARSLTNGIFPMRLEANFPYGYGYADGVLYGSTLLYIPALLWLIGFPVLYSYNLFIILINFATIVVAFWCFRRMFGDKYIGLMCGALYAFSLYRITVLYGRGCVGEGCAQIFLPLLLYGYYRLFAENTETKSYGRTWLLLVIGYSGVLQSHTLTCELALVWTVVVCLINVRRVFCRPVFAQLIKGAAVTLLCNVWYIVPFLDYYISEDLLIKNLGKQMIQHQGITLDLVFVHFFDGILTDAQGMPVRAVGPGLIPMMALFMFFVLAVIAFIRKKKSGLLAACGLCAFLSGICIIFSLRIFPWDWFQQTGPIAERIVSSFLIPTRFLNWGTLFLVPAFGYCLWYAKYESPWGKVLYALGVTAVTLAVGTSSMYFIYQITHTYSKVRIFDNNQVYGYISGGEYIIYGTDITKLSYDGPKTSDNVELLKYEKGDLEADFTCANGSDTETGYVEVPLFLYKGYQARTGTGEKLECVYGDNNVIRVLIPPDFQDSVFLRFVSPVYWRLSEAVSWGSWLGVILYCVLQAKRGRMCRKASV